jgi:hypothetical protein
LGASFGAWLEFGLLRRALGRRLGPHGPGTGPILGFCLVATLGAAVGVAIQARTGTLHPILVAVVSLIPAGLVYIGVLAAHRRRSERGRANRVG